MTEVPKPLSPLPWSRREGQPPIFDANGAPVSFVQNAEYLFHVQQSHDPLISKLYRLRNLVKEADIDRWHEEELAEVDAMLRRVGAIP